MQDNEQKTYADIAEELHDDGEDILAVEKTEKKIRHFSMKKTLILAAIALVLIAALTVCYIFFIPHDKQEAYSKVLIERQQNELTSIEVDNRLSGDQMKLTSFMDGTTFAWNIEGQAYGDVNQNHVASLARCFQYLEATRAIAYDTAHLEEYGLKEPSVTAKATYSDGSTVTVLLGDKYGDEEGTYVMLEGEKEIYVVSVYTYIYLSYGLSDLLNLPTLSKTGLSAQTVMLINREKDLLQLSYIPGPLSGTEAWYLLEPTVSETDSEAIDNLFAAIGNIALNSLCSPAAGEDLAQWGFDQPYYEVISYDSEGTCLDDLIVGKAMEEGGNEYYCSLLHGDEATIENSPVYTVKLDYITPLNVSAVDISNPYLLALNISWLRHGVIHAEGKDYEITIDRKLKYDDDGNVLKDDDGLDDTENTYYINGLKLDTLQFRTFYSKILFLSMEGVTDKDTPHEETLFSYELEVALPVTDNATGKSYVKNVTYRGQYDRISYNYAVFSSNDTVSEEEGTQEKTGVFTVRVRSIEAVLESLRLLLEGNLPVTVN